MRKSSLWASAGFTVMDNHLHVLLLLDPEVASGWSDEGVVRRWGQLFAPRDESRKPLPVTDDWVRQCLKDGRKVKKYRKRLQSLSWFMKMLEGAAGAVGQSTGQDARHGF